VDRTGIVVARKAVDPLLQALRTKTVPRLVHTCCACLGLAVAYWIFRRPTIKDPVERLRSSGAL
jgi:hypothetical protein